MSEEPPGGSPSRPVVEPDDTLRRLAERVWVGGSPLRILRLSAPGDAALTELHRRGRWTACSPAEVRLRERLVAAGAAHPVIRADPDPPGAVLVASGRSEVTVVVPVRDDPNGLAGVLSDLARCDPVSGHQGLRGGAPVGDGQREPAGPPHPEVVIVDDGSVDAPEVAHLAGRHGATLLRHDEPRGPAAARNTGLAAVSTAFVVLMDSDVRFDGPWWNTLMAHLSASPDEGVVAVAPRVVGSDRRGWLASYERRHGPLDLGERPARVAPGTRVAYVPSAALLARTDALRSVGGFDEAIRFGEDVDLMWRLVSSGRGVRYEPAREVSHRPRAGLRSWLRQRFDYGTSAARLDLRYPGWTAPVVISPWSAFAWATAAGGAPGVAAGIVIGSSVALAAKLDVVPAHVGVRLAVEGQLGAGAQLLRAVLRPWWPLALIAAVLSKRVRVLLGAAIAFRAATTRGPVTDRLLAVLDDLAYSTGVWAGVVRARRFGAVSPRMARER